MANHYGVESERCIPHEPEAYRCKWEDRNELALRLLAVGKGTFTRRMPGNKDQKGIVGRDHAYIEVES